MTGWVKSLQCKSRAANDVVSYNLLPASTSCRFQTLADVIETAKSKKHKRKKPIVKAHPPSPPPVQPKPATRTRSAASTRSASFPALTELPEGHPSRNVIEIIFHTSWSNKSVFPVRVEMVFKVQNSTRVAARFEEYREGVKSSTRFDSECEDHARCLADGNEVMRFYCLGPAACGAGIDCAWGFHGGKGSAICTFSGSGGAHDSAGGGKGRRAMLVCRVVAGRVGFDSVSREKGELLVFDTRAVLPCFLIIYKV